VAISTARRWVLSASKDRTVRAWALDTGTPVRVLGEHPDEVLSVATTPDGHSAISSAADGSMRIWDLATDDAPRALAGHSGRTWGLAVSPDGQRLASASWDRTFKLWDLASGQELAMAVIDVRTACASFVSDRQIVIGDHLGSVACLHLVGGEQTR
jgi:WD40 repeat protein